ncbi:MAG: hypothetical protein KKC05_00305, partial [Nanoarchaeota archaeon]|nr:hypothetical protein [Nanoarchaeota archaeon]
MKIKKFLAGSLAAVFAAAFVVGGAYATLGDYVSTTGGDTLSSPMIVVGSSVPGSDVIGAADIAAAVAGYATTTTTVSGVGTVAVSNGVGLDTTNSKLFYADAMNATKTTLTSTDLPTILKSGTFQDDDGTEYKYDQYIVLGSRATEFGNSGGDIEDPEGYVNIGTTAGSFLYNTRVVFTKALNISANTATEGNTIELFGKEFTITSGSTATKLVLFDSSSAQTFTEGESQTVTVDGQEYTITLEGVSSTTVGVISVAKGTGAAVSKEVTEGNSYKVNSLNVVAEDIFYFGENKINKAKMSFGSGKVTMEHGQEVKLGTDLEPIDNTYVAITGNPMSTLEVWVAADDSEFDHIGKDSKFTDTVWGGFKTAFGGFNPDLDDSTRTMVQLATTGDRTSTLKMTDYRGNEKTIEYGWDTNTGSTTFVPALNTSDNYQIHVVEGEAVLKKDYVVLSQGDFGHLFQVTSISNINSTNARIDIKDVFSGETISINLDVTPPGYTQATAYIDGNTYYVNATANEVKFTWGTGAGAGDTGTQKSVFPYLKGQNGEDIALVKSAAFTLGDIVYLPGGNSETGTTQGTTAITLTNTSAYADGVRNETYPAGQLFWNVSYTVASGVASAPTIWGVGSAGSTVRLHSGGYDVPTVIVLEEKGKNTAGTEVRDAIIVPTTTEGTDNVKMAQSTATLTAATQSSAVSWKSDTDKTSQMDRFGTLVVRDASDENTVTIYYPDVQSSATLAVGSDPTFSTTVGGTTVETAVKIMNPVA